MPSEITYKDILLYKTENCRNWDERGFCRYGKRCRYAHGKEELRAISRSNQYKTKTCKAYHEGGSCPYGIRCTFIHHTSDKPINFDSISGSGQQGDGVSSSATSSATKAVTPTYTASSLSTLSSSSSSRILPVATAAASISNTTTTSPFTNNGIWGSMLGLSDYYNPAHYQQPISKANGSFDKSFYDDSYYYNPSFSSFYNTTF